MSSLRKLMGTIVFFGAVASCGKAPQSTESHDDGKIVRSSLSTNWIVMDRASFLTRVLQTTEKDALPANSFSTLRLQSWIDKIDAYARKRDPNLLASIPKPNVIVLKTSEANAYVASTPVCYNVKVTYGNGHKSAPNGVYIDKSLDLLDVDIPPNFPCINTEVSDLPAIAEEISKRGQSCSFKVSPDGIQIPSSCGTVDPAYKGGFTASKLFLLKTPNWFVVLSGIVDLLKNEESLVGVLAHELGHYYRSHSNVYKNEYDFYYTQKEAGNPNHKPVRDESLENFGRSVFKASALYYPISLIPESQNFKLDPILFLLVGDIARQAGDLSSCKKAALYESPMPARDLGAMPFGLPVNVGTYESFVAFANQCLEDIEATEKIRDKINLRVSLKAPKWAPFLKNAAYTKEQRVQFQSQVETVFEVLGSNVTLPIKFTKNDVLNMAVAMRANANRVRDTLQKAYDEKLGQYTAEQEADDLSVEILSKIGLGGETAVDTYMALVNSSEGLGGFEIGLKRCEQLRANGWNDPEGIFDIQILPVGDYSEVHHSGCYRAFNAAREVKAHNYTARASVSIDPSIWSKMKHELTSKKFSRNRVKKSDNFDKLLIYPKGCSFAPKTY